LTYKKFPSPPLRKKEIAPPTAEMSGADSAEGSRGGAEASVDDAMADVDSANASRGCANGSNDNEMASNNSADGSNDKEIDGK